MTETVNGYVCRNCSDVALARRNIDPAHPKDGPADAKRTSSVLPIDRDAAVTFGGTLAVTRAAQSGGADLRQGRDPFQPAAQPGSGFSLTV